MSVWLISALVSLTAWLFLWRGWHGYWRADQVLKAARADDRHQASVVAIIPARNEADTVADCLAGLSRQAYSGNFRIILVDDNSTDGTGEIAGRVARARPGMHPIEVIEAPALQAGWTGKLWALNFGLTELARQGQTPDFIWFTDADVVHGPATLKRLITNSESQGSALVSLMVRLSASGFWERWIIPAFVYFFQLLYPFPAVNDPRSKIAGAAGGCILIRKDVLDEIGGLHRIRSALIDDCALAAAVKGAGHRIWLGLADDSRSCRPYRFADMWRMITRTAFTQLDYSVLALVGTVLGLAVLFLVPPASALFLPWHGDTAAALSGLAAWGLIAGLYRPTLVYYGRPIGEAIALPVVAALYAAMTIASAVDHWRGRTGRWKGRHYGLDREQDIKSR